MSPERILIMRESIDPKVVPPISTYYTGDTKTRKKQK